MVGVIYNPFLDELFSAAKGQVSVPVGSWPPHACVGVGQGRSCDAVRISFCFYCQGAFLNDRPISVSDVKSVGSAMIMNSTLAWAALCDWSCMGFRVCFVAWDPGQPFCVFVVDALPCFLRRCQCWCL